MAGVRDGGETRHCGEHGNEAISADDSHSRVPRLLLEPRD
jgi:hypothetical protein